MTMTLKLAGTWSGHWEFHEHGTLTMTLKLVGTWSGHWEFHEHDTLRVVGDGALGVSKSMHYETLLKKESHSAAPSGNEDTDFNFRFNLPLADECLK